MVSRHEIVLPNELIERCKKCGDKIVQWYKDNPGSRSAQVSVLGIEHNSNEQAQAKMAECAFALWAGLNPITALQWGHKADEGWDVIITRRCLRVDVKRTKADNRFLIWSYGKQFFAEVKVDVLVLVKGTAPSFLVSGWMSKIDFLQKHQTAGDNHVLKQGTWFMEELYGMESLRAYMELVRENKA